MAIYLQNTLETTRRFVTNPENIKTAIAGSAIGVLSCVSVCVLTGASLGTVVLTGFSAAGVVAALALKHFLSQRQERREQAPLALLEEAQVEQAQEEPDVAPLEQEDEIEEEVVEEAEEEGPRRILPKEVRFATLFSTLETRLKEDHSSFADFLQNGDPESLLKPIKKENPAAADYGRIWNPLNWNPVFADFSKRELAKRDQNTIDALSCWEYAKDHLEGETGIIALLLEQKRLDCQGNQDRYPVDFIKEEIPVRILVQGKNARTLQFKDVPEHTLKERLGQRLKAYIELMVTELSSLNLN